MTTTTTTTTATATAIGSKSAGRPGVFARLRARATARATGPAAAGGVLPEYRRVPVGRRFRRYDHDLASPAIYDYFDRAARDRRDEDQARLRSMFRRAEWWATHAEAAADPADVHQAAAVTSAWAAAAGLYVQVLEQNR